MQAPVLRSHNPLELDENPPKIPGHCHPFGRRDTEGCALKIAATTTLGLCR